MRKTGIVLAILFGLCAFASARASESNLDELIQSCMAVAKTDCTKWASAGGGGGGFPRGLTSGVTVELAAGEAYVLSGVITIVKNEVYLAIDLDDQPWLASSRRKQQPFYRIDDDAAKWRNYSRKKVSGIFRVEGSIWSTTNGRYTYDLYLTPTEGSVLNNP